MASGGNVRWILDSRSNTYQRRYHRGGSGGRGGNDNNSRNPTPTPTTPPPPALGSYMAVLRAFARRVNIRRNEETSDEEEESGPVPRSAVTATHCFSGASESEASSASGELSELPGTEEISKALECPVCKEACVPPIWNCCSGHIVCNTCRPKMAECGLCKKSFTEGRNYPMEAIAIAAKFHCQYKPEGCQEIILGEKFTEHVKNCRFRHLRVATTPSSALAPNPNDSWYSSLSNDSFEGYEDWSQDNSEFDDDEGDDIDLNQARISIDTDEDEPQPVRVSRFQTTVWVRQANGQYPENAVVGGTSPSGENLYVIRAYQGPVAVSGLLCPSEGAAHIVFHGRAYRKWYYDVLVACPGTVNWINYWREEGANEPLIFPEGTISAKDGVHYPYIIARARQPDGRYVCGTIPPRFSAGGGAYREPQGCYYKNLTRNGGAQYADRRLQILVHVETD